MQHLFQLVDFGMIRTYDEKIAVLGGGLSGLLFSCMCRNSEVLEAESRPGGLCRSIKKNGFIFDFGGHIIFSRNKKLVEDLLKLSDVSCEEHNRMNCVYCHDALVPYPFENGIAVLPKDISQACARDYSGKFDISACNLKTWLKSCFGQTICDLYLFPYNSKIWKRSLSELSTEWAILRIPRAPKKDVLQAADGKITIGHSHQAKFLYPTKGGIQSLIDSLAPRAKVVTDFRVSDIRKHNDRWEVSNGIKTYSYDRIVSTIPLPELVRCLYNVPNEIKNVAEHLAYNSVSVAMLGIQGKNKSKFTAIYYPQSNVPFHRVCCTNSFSASNTPANHIGLIVEISHHPDEIPQSDEELLNTVREGLRKVGLCDPSKIIFERVCRYKYAYIVDVIEQRKKLGLIKRYLNGLGIKLLGRNGQFEYLNMDQCFDSARNLTRQMSCLPREL